jgi:hypothetical protein
VEDGEAPDDRARAEERHEDEQDQPAAGSGDPPRAPWLEDLFLIEDLFGDGHRLIPLAVTGGLAVTARIIGCRRFDVQSARRVMGGAGAIDPRMQAAMTTPLPELVLYTRDGCHLCHEARAIVQGLLEDRAARGRRSAALHERDIATDPAWERQFFATIPVVEVDGRRLELATSPAKIRRFLDDVLDGSLV